MNYCCRFLPRIIFALLLSTGSSFLTGATSAPSSMIKALEQPISAQHKIALPALDTCQTVQYYHPASDKLPLPLYLCHHSVTGFNRLADSPAWDNTWLPAKQHYQGLADIVLDSRLPSMALAAGQRWYAMFAAGAEPSRPVVQVTELISPYFGCQLELSEQGFSDPCTSANWDKLGRLLAPVPDLPDQSLRQFPFMLDQQQVHLGTADTTLNWQLMSFTPDLHDTALPLLARVGKGLFWGMLTEVKTLWPEVVAMGKLSESQQSQLFIMAVAKQQTDAVRWLVEQGLNPMATNEYGDNALSVANMIESTAMQDLLSELSAAQHQ